jgi:hypothetical protein
MVILSPHLDKIILTVILILVSLSVSLWGEATSKVTYIANRGYPFSIMTITDRVNLYSCMDFNLCITTNIQKFYPSELLLDILIWYLVSCLLVFVYDAVTRRSSFLQPNIFKITLLIVIMAITLFLSDISHTGPVIVLEAKLGLPVPFADIYVFAKDACMPKYFCFDPHIRHFYSYAFLLDLTFWYLVSCTLASVYTTYIKRRPVSNLER